MSNDILEEYTEVNRSTKEGKVLILAGANKYCLRTKNSRMKTHGTKAKRCLTFEIG